MNILGKTKEKKQETVKSPDGQTVSVKKLFEFASLEPIPFKHTEKFIEDGVNPLEAERQRIKDKSVDWLLAKMRDPGIKADTRLEIEEGKRQHTEHIYNCQTIVDKANGEFKRALKLRENIENEIAEYDRMKDELITNSKKVS